MPQLDHWQWWARETGALRVRNGRMVGVEAWRKRRTKDPVDEARTAFGVLLAYGPLASYRPGTSWPTTGLVDAMVAPLLALMLAAPGPVEFAELAEAVEAAGEATGRRPTIGDREFLRDDVARTLDLLLTLLERAGVVTQHDPTFEAGRFSERRTGGFVELTPFGIVTAVEQVRESGPEVVTVGAPATTTSEEVADLAAEQAIAPDDWWALVDEWSASQPDRQAALIELLADLSDRSALLATALFPPPDKLANALEAVMRQLATAHRPDEVLGAVALTWLVRGDHLDEGRVPPDDLLTSSFTMLALLAAEDPESVPEAMGTERQRQDHVDVVREAARRMPPHVEALLTAVDRHHPDPAVAKAARKELIRVRSRLAERGTG